MDREKLMNLPHLENKVGEKALKMCTRLKINDCENMFLLPILKITDDSIVYTKCIKSSKAYILETPDMYRYENLPVYDLLIIMDQRSNRVEDTLIYDDEELDLLLQDYLACISKYGSNGNIFMNRQDGRNGIHKCLYKLESVIDDELKEFKTYKFYKELI